MNRLVAAAVGGLVIGLLPVAAVLPASAATSRAAAPATLISTTTSLKATEAPGTTTGKVVFGIKVKAASGAIPQGTVTLTVDAGTPVPLTLKATGRATYTHHYKPGTHTATAAYGGSATDAASTVTITFTVT